MRYITIEGGTPLRGEVAVQGAKNSVLPILAATLLSGDVCRIEGCPHLSDVDSAADILRYLGCAVQWDGDDLLVDSTTLTRCDIPQTLMRRMRSSVIFLGAILARCGWAELSYPGGCELGPRPIDLHLSALRALGADISDAGGTLRCRAAHLRGCQIVLATPSVGATENAMLAACGAEGETVICNAAREPEIADLQDFLCAMGAEVRGAGGSVITVSPRRKLHGCVHRVIPDRIVAATYLCAAAAAGGEVTLRNAEHRHLAAVTTVLDQAGCGVRCGLVFGNLLGEFLGFGNQLGLFVGRSRGDLLADFLLLRTGSLEFLQRGTTNLVGAQHLVDQFDRFATLALGFLNNVSMFTNELDIKHAS